MRSARARAARWLTIGVMAGMFPSVPASAQEHQEHQHQKQVLVLYATRRDAQIVVIGDRELQRMFTERLPEDVDYYSEYLDQARFSTPGNEVAFRDSLRLRYERHSFDLVIAMGDAPLEFLDRNRDLFPDAPIVFFSADPATRRVANSTGLVVPVNLRATVDLAMALQPDLQHVFVITGATGILLDEARREFEALAPRLEVTYLSGLVSTDLESRLSSLPPHSAVVYLAVDRDAAAKNFRPLDYLDRVTTAANAPVYSWVDSAIGHGVVGGSLKSQEQQAREVGEVAVRVLRGESADSIPIGSPDLNVTEIDWRELRRWGIDDARVPVGATVRFRQLSVWSQYRAYILAGVMILLAQSGLIAGLLIQSVRRRRAEEDARGSQEKLRASYERIRDLAGRLLNAQETERARIARDLHDDISQQMALLEIDLEMLGGSVEGDGEGFAEDALVRARAIARSVHDLSHRLHPAKLRLIGLVAAIQGLARELSQPGVPVVFTHDRIPASLPAEVTLCVFRVAQEALQNAVKHGKAHRITVRLEGHDEGLRLAVADDGAGFDVGRVWTAGLGLVSMSERLEAIGGSLAIDSRPGGGTRLEARVPIRAADRIDAVAG